jgi:hypothetical protein
MCKIKMSKEPPAFDPTIDELQLDTEWLKQPRLYYDWAIYYADAKRDLATQKQKLDVVKAELAREIRSDPVRYNLDKVTETTVPACVLEQLEYKDANRDYINAQHRADVLGAAVAALEHRRRALENLVDLHGQNYFSQPRAHSDGGREALATMERQNRRRGMTDDEADPE